MPATTFSKKDRFLGTVKSITTLSTTLSSGQTEEQIITADNGEIWEIIAVQVFVDADGDATSGTHQAGYIPSDKVSGIGSAVFAIQSDYNGKINLENNNIKNGTLNKFDGSTYEANEALRGTLIDDSNGIKVIYKNNTDAAQENDRAFTIIAKRWEA